MTYREFMNGNPERKRSPRFEYGTNWRHVNDPHGFGWRLAWIMRTGELFAVEVVPHYEDRRLELLGIYPKYEELERLLAGWETEPTRIGSIANTRYFEG